MSAMPISPSEKQSQVALKFVGPSSTTATSNSILFPSSNKADGGDIIYLQDPQTGDLNPSFSVQFSRTNPRIALSKIFKVDDPPQVIGTSERGLTAKHHLSLRGQEAELGDSILGGRKLKIPVIGEFKIESNLSESGIEFIDSQKTQVALCSWSGAIPTLEIFAQGARDEFIEMLILAAMSLMFSGKRKAKMIGVGI